MFKKKSTTTMPTELNMSFNIKKKKKKNQATVLVEKIDVKFSNTRRRSSH